tara:strand:+ start:262 stop:591 length:330 start_codon:yes stop_codon:yes gene_type:complete
MYYIKQIEALEEKNAELEKQNSKLLALVRESDENIVTNIVESNKKLMTEVVETNQQISNFLEASKEISDSFKMEFLTLINKKHESIAMSISKSNREICGEIKQRRKQTF